MSRPAYLPRDGSGDEACGEPGRGAERRGTELAGRGLQEHDRAAPRIVEGREQPGRGRQGVGP